MTPHDWQKPWISSLAFALGGDAIPMIDEKGQRLVDDGLLVLMNPHHEPIPFKLPAEEEGGGWLLEIDTDALDKPRRHAVRGRIRGRGARAGGAAPAARSDGRARGGGRARPGHQEGGAAAAAARRDHHPPVFDPVVGRLGAGRDPRSAAVRHLGGPRRLLGPAALARQRGQRRRSQPLRGQLRVRARPDLPFARSLRGLRGSRRPRGVAGRPRRAHRRSETIRGRRLADRPRAEARRHRARIRTLPARRVAPAIAARPAPVRVHPRQPLVAGRSLSVHRAARRTAAQLARLAGPAPRSGSGRDRGGPARARRRAARRRSGCSGSWTCSGAARAARPAWPASS